jgi:nitrate/nitrite transporter NarK
VHRTSAGMFTISYSCTTLLAIAGGWLSDLTNMPITSFAPVALCAIVIVVLASTVKNARRRRDASVSRDRQWAKVAKAAGLKPEQPFRSNTVVSKSVVASVVDEAI